MVDLTLPDPSPAPDSGDAAERLAARVQAWQHRHPLARRLPVADVGGLGVIALPFDTPEAAGKLRPLFHQPSLIPGLSHRALVEFAQRHAVTYRPGPADWPLREVERADASSEPAPETRYLLTAAITEPVKPGAQPRRLLIAPEGSAIWGPRPLSRTRVIGAALVLLLILIAVVWGLRGRSSLGAAPPPALSASVVAASMPQPAAAASVPATVPSRPVAAPVAASVVAPVASVPARMGPTVSAVASAVAPVVSTPKVAVVPARGPSTPAAPIASTPDAASPPASAVLPPSSKLLPPPSKLLPPPPKLLPMPALRSAAASAAVAAPAPAPAASAAVPTGPHFALVSVPSRKRAGAEETLARIRKLLGPAIGSLQAQIMPTPEGFVVTIWPLPTQADAEQLADVLARRGVPMRWLEF